MNSPNKFKKDDSKTSAESNKSDSGNKADKSLSNSDYSNSNKNSDRSISVTIGKYLAISVIVLIGIFAGIFGRLVLDDDRFFVFNLKDFSVKLPFEPVEEESLGLPPFSNRKIRKYTAAVSEAKQYQIIVMERKENADDSEPNLSRPFAELKNDDPEIEQWAQSTLGVLCADENKKLLQKCLAPGSRITNWKIITADGSTVRGSIRRTGAGKMVQLLASNVDEEDAAEFIDSFSPRQ